MCGATGAQEELQSEQAAFYRTMTSEYSKVFGESQNILNSLTETFKPILEAGPGQKGFSEGEFNDLNTEATEGVARNYAQASKAVNERMAAEGGGDTLLPSGTKSQVNASLASAAESQRSGEQLQIDEADYSAGRQQWQYAANELSGVASQLDPSRFAGATTGAGSAAGETANQIAQENDSWIAPVAGAVGGVLSSAAMGFNKPSGGGQTTTIGNSSYGLTGEQGGGIGWNQDAYGVSGGQ